MARERDLRPEPATTLSRTNSAIQFGSLALSEKGAGDASLSSGEAGLELLHHRDLVDQLGLGRARAVHSAELSEQCP